MSVVIAVNFLFFSVITFGFGRKDPLEKIEMISLCLTSILAMLNFFVLIELLTT